MKTTTIFALIALSLACLLAAGCGDAGTPDDYAPYCRDLSSSLASAQVTDCGVSRLGRECVTCQGLRWPARARVLGDHGVCLLDAQDGLAVDAVCVPTCAECLEPAIIE